MGSEFTDKEGGQECGGANENNFERSVGTGGFDWKDSRRVDLCLRIESGTNWMDERIDAVRDPISR